MCDGRSWTPARGVVPDMHRSRRQRLGCLPPLSRAVHRDQDQHDERDGAEYEHRSAGAVIAVYPYRDTDQHDRAPTEELPGGGICTVTVRLKYGAVYV